MVNFLETRFSIGMYNSKYNGINKLKLISYFIKDNFQEVYGICKMYA